MSVANDVLKWSKKNRKHSGSGNEIFVPGVTYPHMHVTNKYVGYSTGRTKHRPLVEGDNIHWGTVDAVVNEAVGEARAVAAYIQNTYQR